MQKHRVSEGGEEAASRLFGSATAYCRLIEACEGLSKDDFLARAHMALVELYMSALELPSSDDLLASANAYGSESDTEVESLIGAMDPGLYPAILQRLCEQLGAHRHYFVIFDPWDLEDNQPVAADLADDLSDIYRDVSVGLAYWAAGARRSAIREWRQHFEAHWGQHATSAIRALYALARSRSGLWRPSTPGAA